MLTSQKLRNLHYFLLCNGRNSAICRLLMCGLAPWCVVEWGQRENLVVKNRWLRDFVTSPTLGP